MHNSLWIYTMNRCKTFAFRRWLTGACLLALSLSAQAQTAVRQFPAQAVRATMVVAQRLQRLPPLKGKKGK